MSAPSGTEKEVFMDIAPSQEGGTRRRRRRRRTQKGGDAPADQQTSEPSSLVSVQKEGATEITPVQSNAAANTNAVAANTNTVAVNTNKVAVNTNPTPVATQPATNISTQSQVGGATVVLSPAKKKTKVMLVPKATGKHKPLIKKTFKAKRVHLTIDNTPATVKRRRMTIKRVDGLTDDQVRDAAVTARLSRRGAKAPIGLLRQMLKDYQTMKGMLL